MSRATVPAACAGCNKPFYPRLNNLRAGGGKFCSRACSVRFVDIAGNRYGRLLVLERVGSNSHRRVTWKVRCDCGQELVVSANKLRSGHTASCGCLHSDVTAARNFKHGGAHSPTHNIWKGMTKRCVNEAAENFEYYGGRGITVCERWASSYANFLADMGERPSPLHSIDRIDTDKGYEPGNCRWLLLDKQNRNKRNNRRINFNGETLTLVEWAERTGVGYSALLQRLNKGWTVAKAFTTPHRKISRRKSSG